MKIKLILFLLAFCVSCSNIEDAKPGNRNTFIKIFNGISGIEAASFEITPEGFVVLGNLNVSTDSVLTVVFETDTQGNLLSDIKYYPGGSGKSIKILPDNQGYIIGGKKVKVNPAATPTDNIEISSARLLHLDVNLNVVRSFYFFDDSPSLIKTDYSGEALTLTSDGKIILLGSYQTSLNSPVRPFIHRYHPETLNLEWSEYFESISRSYRNARSIHYMNNHLIWASAVALEQQNFSFSYVSVPFVQMNSSFINFSLLGQNDNKSIIVNDANPAKPSAFGLGLVGSFSNPDGSNSNIFFCRTDPNGNVLSHTIRYYDAILTADNPDINRDDSQIQDYGTAITPTSDGGFVLAGHFTTNSQKGKGLNDILLIKVSINGEPLWIRTYGGAGSETVQAIQETHDRGLLVLGTNTIGNVSSIFLMKTDKDGNLNR